MLESKVINLNKRICMLHIHKDKCYTTVKVKERLDLHFRGIDGHIIGGEDAWIVVDGAERGDDLRGCLYAAEEGRDEDPVDWEAKMGPELPTRGEGT